MLTLTYSTGNLIFILYIRYKVLFSSIIKFKFWIFFLNKKIQAWASTLYLGRLIYTNPNVVGYQILGTSKQ